MLRALVTMHGRDDEGEVAQRCTLGAVRDVNGVSGELRHQVGTTTVKITDLKCAIIGENPVIRIVTDEGIDGYGQIESTKPYAVPHVLFFKEHSSAKTRRTSSGCMLKIRQRGGFKPWGSAISAIEMALWDIAGKAAGVPVYKLLGGKVRDRVRIYNGGCACRWSSYTPEEYAESTPQDDGAPRGLHHHQAADRVPQPDEAGHPGLLLRRSQPGGLQGGSSAGR